jgi:RTX calcium-binding nonapeptide repeat (4 copies)
MAATLRAEEGLAMPSPRLALCLLTLVAALTLPAASAPAAVSCAFDAVAKKVTISANGVSDSPTLQRADGGDAIEVEDLQCGAATTTNTNTIQFNDASAGGSTELTVDLRNGPLGPGATLEGFTTSEIEILASFGDGGGDKIVVKGPQRVTAGAIAGGQGLNVTPLELAPDADIVGTGVDRIDYHSPFGVDSEFHGNGGVGFTGPLTAPVLLYGTIAADTLEGGAGDDLINGGNGDNTLLGGDGDDQLWPNYGTDVVDGQDGVDVVSYGNVDLPVRVDLGVAGPQDTQGSGLDTISGVEGLVGTFTDDVLAGDAQANSIDGHDGDDTILVRDGIADVVECGDGDDTVVTDLVGVDTLGACETVDALSPPDAAPAAPAGAPGAEAASATAAGGATAAAVTASSRRALRLTLRAAKRLRRGRLATALTCDAACTVRLRAVVTVGKRRLVVRATRRLAAGRRTTVALRMPRRARRVSLRATASSPGLIPATVSKRLRVAS